MNASFESVIANHHDWVQRFRDAITAQTTSESLSSCAYDDLCAFGKWLYAQDDEVKMSPPYRRVKDLHYQFHQDAALIVEQMHAGHFDLARRMTDGGLAEISAKLVQAIRDWEQAGSAA